MKKTVIRKWSLYAFAFLAVTAIALFQQHSKNVEAERVAEQDARCAKQAASPYVPFKADFDCVGWKRVKSDVPLPIAG